MINRLLIILFGFLLITVLITSGLSLFSQSIRLDESQSIWISTKPFLALLETTAEDVHVPLYGILLHLWMQFLGTNILVVRSLSFIFFILTLPILYKLVKESSSSKVANLTVLLFALSPFVAWYGYEARMYTLFTLIACLNNLYFVRFIRSNGKVGKLGLFFSSLVGLYTHYFFIFLLITQLIFIITKLILKNSSFKETINRSLVFKYISVIGISFLFFTPWIVYVFTLGVAANTQPSIPTPTAYNLLQTFAVFLFGFQTPITQALVISLWPLLIVMLFLIFTQRRKLAAENLSYFVMVTFLPIFLVFAVSMIRPIFLSRYLIFIVPTLFFLLALILLNYSRKISTALVSIFVVTMFGLLVLQNTSAQTPTREDYTSVAIYLEKNATPEDIIAVSAPFTIYPLEYSYQGSVRIDTIPLWDRFSEGSMPQYSEENLKPQLANYKTKYRRIFLVLSYDQGYEAKLRSYFDHNYHMLDNIDFSSNINLRVYKLRYDI